MQNVQASLLPFHLHRQTLQVPEGLTLKEIADFIFPNKTRGIKLVINIGDEVVPISRWGSIKPKPHTLIGINAIAAGGGGGKKNALAILITIAVIVAAPYIAAALAPEAAGAVAAGTATFAQTATIGAIRIGVGLIGFLASSMLSSVPKQRSTPQASPTEPSSQFIEGASNKIDPYGVVPVNLGVNRMFPPQAALPYTETSSNNQYVRQLFTYGFGKVSITERRIGETLISDYDGVEMSDRLNADLADGTTLYTNNVHQDGYSVVLSSATGYVTQTTQRNSDEADVDITFVGGLTSYNDSAQRTNQTVQFEISYALTGTGDWSNSGSYGSQTVAVPFPAAWNTAQNKRIGYGILALNLHTGVVTAVSYDSDATPIVPPDCIRIASFRTESTSATISGGTATVASLIDERASYIPNLISGGGDFLPTYSGPGLNIGIAAGDIVSQTLTVTAATAEALRISRKIKFPSKDQYDIRIKRLTDDTDDDRIRDVATLTAIRSITYGAPVKQANVSGTGVRILATDQLNGSISSYNCIVKSLILDYDEDSESWIEDVISSNPASIYRYVLQTPAFVKHLSDDRINIDKLEEWHTYCKTNNLTYNKIIDSPTSVDDLLNDIASSGMATPHKISGVYSVLIDNERPEFQGMVTPRNSASYSGTITYPDLPHALRVQFRNSAAGYNTDEVIVYADGYDEDNAILYERLQFDSCTNSDLAWFYGRMYMATILLQPEIHTFNMDFENLTFNRGDKIVFVNDVILVGVGSGRIKELIYDDPDSPTEVLGFVLDDVVNIPTVDNFGVRIRHADASGFIYYGLTTTVGETSDFTFTTPVAVDDAPPLDSLCAFTEFGKELELIITEIKMNKDHSAAITAVNYAPERFDAVDGDIPPFNSNITLSSDFFRPNPPTLNGDIQSDETVMIKNSDGSFTSRMLIPLINTNEPSVQTVVRSRPSGATEFSRPDILSSTPQQIVIAGLEDGAFYDFRISYQRQGGLQLLSTPLILNNIQYKGASAKPDDVQNFHVTSAESVGLFEWTPNQDIDLSHYKMKFTRSTDSPDWNTAQIVADDIKSNRISLYIQKGAYLIKAVDILDNESVDATVIISFDDGALKNVVETLTQFPTWAGTQDNISVTMDDFIYLTDPTLVGYYYFDPAPVDLSEIYESALSSTIVAAGMFYDEDLGLDVRSITSIRSIGSIRGVDHSDWAVFLEMRLSNDGSDWGPGWIPFTVGKRVFRYAEFRLRLESYNPAVTPRVSTATVVIDMPDRQVKGVAESCSSSTGFTITYDPAFKADPAVNITLQNGATDDKLVFSSKDETGFAFKVFNATTAGYVTRTFDYTSTGFGRVVSV